MDVEGLVEEEHDVRLAQLCKRHDLIFGELIHGNVSKVGYCDPLFHVPWKKNHLLTIFEHKQKCFDEVLRGHRVWVMFGELRNDGRVHDEGGP